MHNKPSIRLALAAALAVGLMAASATSASATTYQDGDGAFQAVAVVNTPPEECATYRLYNAELVFPDDRIVATVSSDRDPNSPDFAWGEFATGTFQSSDTAPEGIAHCTTGPGAPIGGFTGTLTYTGVHCTLSNGTYQRGHTGLVKPELNVEYVFQTKSDGCPSVTTPVTIKATIPSVDLPVPITVGPFSFDYLSACNSPIAPQTCVLDKGNF